VISVWASAGTSQWDAANRRTAALITCEKDFESTKAATDVEPRGLRDEAEVRRGLHALHVQLVGVGIPKGDHAGANLPQRRSEPTQIEMPGLRDDIEVVGHPGVD